MKKTLSAIIAASLLVLTACSSGGGATNLGSEDFAKKIAEPGIVILDVRTSGEFYAGHIEGAINIDVEGMQFDADIAKLDKTKTYAVYCHTGRRSGIAVGKMSDAGFTSLFNLSSGITDWQSKGLPVVA